jgi:hypothetical protein
LLIKKEIEIIKNFGQTTKLSNLQKVLAKNTLINPNRGHGEVSKPHGRQNLTIMIAERQGEVPGCAQWELEWFV